MNQDPGKITENKSSIIERRSGKDRRRIFNHGHFLFGRAARKNLLDQRSQAERRVGWVRVNKWSSVYLSDLKIAKFLKQLEINIIHSYRLKLGLLMASNFKFFSYPTRDSLHLELFGDFDGSSAKELVDALVDYGTNFFQIFIDTNNLKTIHPFGRKVFLKSFNTISKQAGKIIFIGKHKQNIDPQSNHFDVYF